MLCRIARQPPRQAPVKLVVGTVLFKLIGQITCMLLYGTYHIAARLFYFHCSFKGGSNKGPGAGVGL